MIFVLCNMCLGHLDYVGSVTAWRGAEPIVISGSSDGTIKAWNTQTGELIATGDGHTRDAWAVAVTHGPKPMIVSGSFDRTVRVWDLNPIIGDLNWDRRKWFAMFLHGLWRFNEKSMVYINMRGEMTVIPPLGKPRSRSNSTQQTINDEIDYTKGCEELEKAMQNTWKVSDNAVVPSGKAKGGLKVEVGEEEEEMEWEGSSSSSSGISSGKWSALKVSKKKSSSVDSPPSILSCSFPSSPSRRSSPSFAISSSLAGSYSPRSPVRKSRNNQQVADSLKELWNNQVSLQL
jgi:hypothetical protein